MFPQKSIQKMPSKCRNDSNSKKPQSLSNYLVVYFNWAFFLGVSPFRFVKEFPNSYKIHKTILQSVISTFITILVFWVTIFGSLRSVFNTPFLGEHTNPLFYFYASSLASLMVLRVWVSKYLWFRQKAFLKLVNYIETNLFETYPIPNKFKINLICFLFLMIGLYEPIWRLFPASLTSVSTSLWSSNTISFARYTFFMVNFTKSQETIQTEEISSFDYLYLTLFLLGWLTR